MAKTVIQNSNLTVQKATGYEPRWDLMAYKKGHDGENAVIDWLATADDTFTIEIKNDVQARQTGNVYLELSCNGQVSGVLRSEATWVSITIGSLILTFQRDLFAEFMSEKATEALHNGNKRGKNPYWIADTTKDPKYPTRGLVYNIAWLVTDVIAYERAARLAA
ncbi:hypothetical protein AAFP35_08310 [Gordonia sp. CPCC 206044]|uniref:hypothetical protein n=1 Tax=Gordonia sp. CPCC 206044 TaxID=3140793 RepID=UPI003AF34C47